MFKFASQLTGNADEAVEVCEEAVDCLDGDVATADLADNGSIGKADFEEALRENERLLMLFLRNSYMEAIEIISEKSNEHFIYSQGHANFTILKAIVTLDPEEIEIALQKCQLALTACHEGRRKVNWFASWIWKVDPDDYTDGIISSDIFSSDIL